jgi:HAD superfamily phosphoserine phosphatase-like hydrolase
MAETTSRRRVVLADWDNTLCEGFTLSAWAEFLAARRLFGTVRTVRNLLDTFQHGSFSYEEFCRRMAEAYADGLAGRSHGEVLEAGAAFIRSDNRRVFRFVRALWAYFDEHDLKVVVLTGAPEEPLKHYADAIGFELGGALRLQVKRGFYTGNIVENCGLYDSKQAAVKRVEQNDEVVIAFGDSVSDLPLLNSAPIGFVVTGAAHNSLPFGPHLIAFDSKLEPMSVTQLVKRRVAEVEDA